MQLRNLLTGLVVTPNQFERADSILRSISAMLSGSSRTGSCVPPPANAEMSLPSFNSFLNDLLLQPLPEQQQEETATEASISSPEVTSDAAPVPKRRKRQLTEAEVKEKLLSGLQSPSSSPALRNENLFDRSVDFGQVCRRILQLDREQNLGLIDQVFLYRRNGCGSAPAPTRNKKLRSHCQRASEVRCLPGKDKSRGGKKNIRAL